MPRQNRRPRPDQPGAAAAPSSLTDLDDRPSKPKKRAWKGDFQAGAPDFFQSQTTAAENKLGHRDALVGTEAERVVIGLPLKAFSLQYLYSSSVYPLGRMEMKIGESDSCKTAKLFESGRWFLREPGGGFIYLLNEGRDPADLRTSIIGEGLLGGGGFRLEGPCAALEDWQRRTTGWLHKVEANFKKIGGCAFPFMLGLDSITGTTNEKAIANIDEEGCAKLTFGQDANLLNQYAKYLFQRVYRWPIAFICTNHIKYGQDRHGNKVMRIPGGDELRYASTYITHLSKSKDIDRLDVAGGRRIVVKTMKSMGDRREVVVDFVWNYDANGIQTSLWDWHAASVELLMNFSGEKGKRVEEIIEFRDVSKPRRTCACPALGIRKADSYDAVGKALMENSQVLTALQNHFGIKRRREFQTNVPYVDQIEEAIKAREVEKHSSADIGKVQSSDEEVSEVLIDSPPEEAT